QLTMSLPQSPATSGTPSRAVLARLRGVHKTYGPVRVLDLPELDLYAGQVVGVVGENEAGKSTLMGALAGSVHRDGGEIEIDGVPLPEGSTEAAGRLGIAMVSQEFPLVGQLSIAENLLLGRRPNGARRGALVDRAATRAEAEQMLRDIGLDPRSVGGVNRGAYPPGADPATYRDSQGMGPGTQAADPGRADLRARPRRGGDGPRPRPAGGRAERHRAVHRPPARRGARRQRPDHCAAQRQARRRPDPGRSHRGAAHPGNGGRRDQPDRAVAARGRRPGP